MPERHDAGDFSGFLKLQRTPEQEQLHQLYMARMRSFNRAAAVFTEFAGRELSQAETQELREKLEQLKHAEET